MIRRPPRSTRTDTRCPYTTLFRSLCGHTHGKVTGTPFQYRCFDADVGNTCINLAANMHEPGIAQRQFASELGQHELDALELYNLLARLLDRKSTRLNSSH